MTSDNPPSEQGRSYKFAFFPTAELIEGDRFRISYHFRTDDAQLRDMLPTVTAQFLIFMTGSGELHFPGGNKAKSDLCYFIAPMTCAAEYHLTGPLHAVGVGLTEIGWAELTGLPVNTISNSTISADEVLGIEVNEFAEGIAEKYLAGAITPKDIATQMQAFLQPRFKRLDIKKIEAIKTIRTWATDGLDPNVRQLYDSMPYSPRQIQRLCLRYFGQSPVQLAKRMRGSFAASILNHIKITPELDAEIGESFFDQSHLIRDVKTMAGRSPTKIGKPKQSVLSDILHPSGFLTDLTSQKIVKSDDKD